MNYQKVIEELEHHASEAAEFLASYPDPDEMESEKAAHRAMVCAVHALRELTQELHELRKDKARLDSGEIMHRCCGDRVHFVKQDLRAAIDEALSQNTEGQPPRP